MNIFIKENDVIANPDYTTLICIIRIDGQKVYCIPFKSSIDTTPNLWIGPYIRVSSQRQKIC